MLYLPSVKWEADLWGKEFWRCVFGAHPPYFLRSLPFLQSFLQAGGVSITLASSKFWVSPLKAFVKSKNAIRFHHQAFIICKNRHIQISLKILIEVIRQKIVSNVILAFWDHLQPRIFFVGNQRPPPFSKSLDLPLECLYLLYLNCLLCFLFIDQTLSTFFTAVWKTNMSL